ncbi:MAG TPA: hypothetical protein VF316_21960 [Polyangiaceae bacterium]
MPKRFAYYDRLSAKEKATYRKSDAVAEVRIPDVTALGVLVRALEETLASGKRLATARASTALVAALARQLGVRSVNVKVRNVRPEYSGGELHGLYTFSQEGETPTIEVWMRTAANERVVRFRTFLRTLLHEVLHHLDVTLLELDDSFHTEGFFRRESSLVRQLAPSAPKKGKAEPKPPKAKPVQLDLFGRARRKAP